MEEKKREMAELASCYDCGYYCEDEKNGPLVSVFIGKMIFS